MPDLIGDVASALGVSKSGSGIVRKAGPNISTIRTKVATSGAHGEGRITRVQGLYLLARAARHLIIKVEDIHDEAAWDAVDTLLNLHAQLFSETFDCEAEDEMAARYERFLGKGGG